jgi:hypothetical protein
MRQELYRLWQLGPLFSLLEPPCCLHRRGLKDKVNIETRIVQAVAAWASVSSVRASMLPTS